MLQRRVSPAKRYLRRTLQVVALVGTIVIAILALALIASQTPWFKNWLRKFVVREANQYLNGTLSVGSLGGNLFYGVNLGDVSIDVNGEHIITLKNVEVKYRISDLLSHGMTIQQIRLDQPYVLLRHDANGWNVANLVKKQSQEADRQGPGKPLSMPDIEIVDGRAVIQDRAPSPSYKLPSRIDSLNLKAGYEYEPVHYSATLGHLSFVGRSPNLTLTNLTGRAGTRGDDVHIEKLFLQTPQSAVTVDGAVQNYLSKPNLQLTVSSPKLSLPEFAPVVPALQGINLHPSLDLKAQGTQDDLKLTVKENSEAGAFNGTVTADALAPDYAVRGNVTVTHLNLAPVLNDPKQKSDITARANVDLKMATTPAGSPILDRTKGSFKIDAPEVVASGYRASDIKVTGIVAGRRVDVDGRASAYGGSATAKGFVVTPAATGGQMQFDVAGSASHMNLRSLPATTGAPRVATDLNASAYHVSGEAGKARTAVNATVTMGQSSIAGGTIVSGTAADVAYVAPQRKGGTPDMRYNARGGLRNVNLYAVGRAFQVPALEKPDYDSRINADFTARGNGTDINTMTADASVNVTDTQIMGGSVPRLAVDAHVANGGVQGKANGELRGFDPSRVSGQQAYKGQVNATVAASFAVNNLSGPITAGAVTADGKITLANSDVGGVKITTADIDGQYANMRGNLRQATVKGPDLDVQASGPIALDRTGTSNLKYHVAATNLADIGKLVNTPLTGSAIVDGTLTGNAASLQATGTLKGSDLGYQDDNVLSLNSQFTATVPDLQFAHARLQAQTTGSFIKAGGIDIQELRATTTYTDQKLDFQTHVAEAPQGAGAVEERGGKVAPAKTPRELDASGSVLFHTDHQEIHLPNLSLSTQGIQWKTAPGQVATIQYGRDRLQLQNVRLVNGTQAIDADGSFPLGASEQPGALTVTAKNVDLSQVDKLTMLNRGISGTLNANAKITGSSKAPGVNGHLEIANGGFQQFKFQSFVADTTYGNDRVTLDAKLVQSPGAELTAKGVVPMSALRANPPGVTGHVEPHAGDEIDVRVQSSQIDLGIVQGFTTAVANVTGTMQADVHVMGSGEDPHLAGYLNLQNGGFAVPVAGTSFTGLTTRIELQPDRVHVPQFQIKDQHGNPLTIQGDLAVHARQAGAVNVSVDADDFKLMDNELGNVHVGTHLKVGGDVRAPRIDGEVRAPSARLELDRILEQFATPYSEQALPDVVTADETITTSKGADQATRDAMAKGREVRAAEEGKLNATAPPTGAAAGGPIAMNVHVVVPDDMVVRGQDLRPGGATSANVGNVNATVGANLRIQKDPEKSIRIRGTVDTVRGFYEFQGRRFTLERGGTMQFLGLDQINPNLNVSATRLIPNTGVTAKIDITGTMRAPQINLTSDPPLDEADILSLIIFNRNVNELGTGERASLADTAGSIASGFIASPLSRSIGKALDVDLFEITTSDPDTGQQAGGVTLGKQVNDKTFIKYRQQFGQRSTIQFMLEYDLAKFLRLQTEYAPETAAAANRLTERRIERAGVDLLFFFSY